jgi:simple sugar transport system permease protein
MAGLAGAALSIGLLNVFQENMTNGLGFIAVALVYFGGWRPFGILAGALLFSTVNALQLWAQVLGIGIPSDLAVMLHYVLTIVALAFAVEHFVDGQAHDQRDDGHQDKDGFLSSSHRFNSK